jgi:tight adherence protein B
MGTVLILLATIAAAAAASLWFRPGPPRSLLRRLETRIEVGPPPASTGSANTSGVARWRPRLVRARAPDVGALLAALAAELDAGQTTDVALQEACRGLDPPPCPRALAAARMGSDVATALREDAQMTSSAGLRALAACWQVASRSGSGLSASVHRLARAHRASARARGELVAELATVRASARLLACLPIVGLLFGIGLGAQPLTWLSATWIGRLTFAAGMALQGVGLLWLRRITARAEAGIP